MPRFPAIHMPYLANARQANPSVLRRHWLATVRNSDGGDQGPRFTGIAGGADSKRKLAESVRVLVTGMEPGRDRRVATEGEGAGALSSSFGLPVAAAGRRVEYLYRKRYESRGIWCVSSLRRVLNLRSG